MNTEELFINASELPRPLHKNELIDLFIRDRQGDVEAREKIVLHNMRLVLNQVTKKFGMVSCDKKELVGVANVGLLKAINTFDITRNIEFSTYASKCIDNEICMFLRKLNKDKALVSMDELISDDMADVSYSLTDFLSYEDTNLDICMNEEIKLAIANFLNSICNRDREIMMMHFGFYDKLFSQYEIAEHLNLSQSYVSRLIVKNLKMLSKYLKTRDLIETVKVKKRNLNKVTSKKI